MHYRHKGSHYSQPKIVRNKFIVNNPRDCDCNDCQKRNRLRRNQLKVNPQLNKRGSDDDRRQIIADLISDDGSPFKPDDEEALRAMSDTSLRQMRDDFMKSNAAVANSSDPAFHVGIAGADFHRRQNELRARSIAYCNSHPIKPQPVTNSDDPAVQAMHENIGAVAYLNAKKGE